MWHERGRSESDFGPWWGGGKGEGKHQTPSKPQGVGGYIIYIYIYNRGRGLTPQNRGSKLDAFPDGVWIDVASILAPQMAPKSRPRGGPDTLSDVYQ